MLVISLNSENLKAVASPGERETRRKKEENVTFTPVTVILFVVICCVMLVLLYFFYKWLGKKLWKYHLTYFSA